MRLVVFFSLTTGALVDWASGSLHASEMSLFRSLLPRLQTGELLLGDRYYGVFAVLASVLERKAHGLFRVAASRLTDFRHGTRLGINDHLVTWTFPTVRPRGLTDEEYARLPRQMLLREIRERVSIPGWRTRELVLVTTLLDSQEFPAEDLVQLYASRWLCEVRLRDLKITLQMDVLRTLTPDMVRKELLARLLAYNLIRTLMWTASRRFHTELQRLSFKGALQHVRAFAPVFAGLPTSQIPIAYEHLLQTLAMENVPYRPHRFEPRLKKRRPKSYGWLQKPRTLCKRLLFLGRPLK